MIFGAERVALFTVSVPVAAPILIVVAAPPMLRVVAVVLNTDAAVLAVVISPSFTARSPSIRRLTKPVPAFVILNVLFVAEPAEPPT